jgi:hypothetical protein
MTARRANPEDVMTSEDMVDDTRLAGILAAPEPVNTRVLVSSPSLAAAWEAYFKAEKAAWAAEDNLAAARKVLTKAQKASGAS